MTHNPPQDLVLQLPPIHWGSSVIAIEHFLQLENFPLSLPEKRAAVGVTV